VKSSEVKVTFDKVEDIYNLHKMFQIELSDRMEKWNEQEEIGSIYNMVSQSAAFTPVYTEPKEADFLRVPSCTCS